HGPSARDGDRAQSWARAGARGHLSRRRNAGPCSAPACPVPGSSSPAAWIPDKGPDILVEALGPLRDPPPTLILGDGRLRAPLRRRVHELGLAKRVHFPGWVAD